MTGADDALFGPDGTTAGGDEPAADAGQDEAGSPSPPAPDAPGWLTGEAAPPWPPPGADRIPVRRTTVPGPPARPRIVEDPSILGLSRRTRGRIGSRVFTWFFVMVFVLIAVQMVVSILYPW